MIRNVITREYALRRTAKLLVVGIAALAVSACGSIGSKMPWSAEPDSSDYAAISSNLVDALSQYTRLNPSLATVQVTPPSSRFESQIQQEMIGRGYNLEQVKAKSASESENIVKARIQASGDAPLYTLSIGDLSVERSFTTVGDITLPSSEMTIRGGNERSVNLNDAELFSGADPSLSVVNFRADTVQVAKTSDSDAQVIEEPAGPGTVAVNTEDPKPAPVKWNMYDTLQSNYVALFDEYEDVDRSILVFPNDSLRLGDGNKQIIDDYVAKMDPETDVLSVIGCSHGTSDLDNGNSLLALGRANRVKEAFLFSGVEHEHVMDEGCWAPQAFDEVMPRRGVVLTLKRRKNS